MLTALLLGACAGEPAPAQEPAPEPPVSQEDDVFFGKRPKVQPALGPYTQVRPSAVAGSWYSDDPTELSAELDGYLAGVQPTCGPDLPLALVSPHAGYRYSGATAGQATGQVKGCMVRRVWVLAPTHRIHLDGVGLYDVQAFRTPLGDLPLDAQVISRLASQPGFSMLSRGDQGEHSLEIQLPLLQRAIGSFELVPLLVGNVDAAGARSIAAAIRPELGPGDLVVVSTDFTHHGGRFGFAPYAGDADIASELSQLDHGAWVHVAEPDPEKLHAYMADTQATICGRNPLKILTALVPEGSKGTELAYTTTGDLTGDWSSTVSYLAGRLDGPSWSGRGPQSGGARFVSEETGQWLLELAWRSLRHFYEFGERLELDPATVPEEARQTLGAFVTLEKDGRLRGCIGEITPYRPAWQAVLERAVDAATRDGRFHPVTEAEVDELTLDISLLGPSWRVPGPQGFIVGRHGVVVSKGGRRATFLPQVAPDQGWDRGTTLQRLRQKAGIPGQGSTDLDIDVYEAQVILPAGH